MSCEFCGRPELHLCSQRIAAYGDSLTPEQQAQKTADMRESLQKAIAASKELREKYGVELVCNQRNIDYLESRTDVEDLDTDLIR